MTPELLKPEVTLAWVSDGTERLLADVAGLSDAALDAPTALPGWSRRYLVSHVAANADALRNLAGVGSPIPVSAPLADLAAYLTGRPSAELKAAPALPAWL
jgi:maleylpyruvate isomerase